ncbi:lantibiotic dehydratase [Peterkaempfera bronchialis]|uniref:Bacteriocin biosynthesis protein n=1 Tax=Peterkaempfera bronchialis TaxID=2126346 RepID=A0A345SZ25_9ACTN|nr:lantibiotic dehydratase [Peterkaempfera bronchialis]AXI78980.1 bacteriocin biosynthesis protein [Peterkaempfera bronchialis]
MYHAVDAALIRASARPLAAELPPWPNLDGSSPDDVEGWREWIGQVWATDATAEAITFASPVLAEAVRGVLTGRLRQPRATLRATLSLMRYLLRMQYRPTPFGLFAGTAPVRLGRTAKVHRGTDHRGSARPDAEWLAEVASDLETRSALLRRLPVMADPTRIVRGAKVVVPHQPGADGPVEMSMRHTPAVEVVLSLAHSPITAGEIVAELQADYPDMPVAAIEDMVRRLVKHGLLLTSLRAPMTTDDALGHLISQLDILGAGTVSETGGIPGQLRRIHQLLTRHDAAPADEQRTIRAEAAHRMTAVTEVTERTLIVNLRPDCDTVLPLVVAEEAQRVLAVMARISPYPAGPPAWQDYRARFLERYSMGALVPVRDLTDPDIGLGVPAGYRGSVLKRPVLATSRRDEYLLALAQDAAANRTREVVLAEEDVASLSVGDFVQVPAHVELCFTVLARSLGDLRQGRFALDLVGLSSAAGTTTGRFLAMLEQPDRDRMSAVYAGLPTLEDGAVRAQISSPPLRLRTQNVSRSPAVVPHVLSLGEYNPTANLDLDDLAVGADARRLFLASLTTGQRIEPSVMNAVELTNATHPLVRFLSEVHRSHVAVMAPFSWGAAARLPFLPQVRVGRTILSRACWRLTRRHVGTAAGADWMRRFTDWRCRYGVTRTVFVGSDDQRLRLDLDHPAHLRILRSELEHASVLTLHEAPEEDAFGWLGHAHEITMPFASDLPPARRIDATAVVRREVGRLPGTTPWAYLKVYSHPDRASEILATCLPALLDQWGDETPQWWFTRYGDPGTHLRVRIRLARPDAFGEVAQRVGAWAAALRNDGLASRIQWDTDEPEIGRYGTGHALDAAERYFTADSAAAIAQMALQIPSGLRQAVTAAGFVDIADAFTGGPAAGRRWLVENLLKSQGVAPPRDVQAHALRLAAPDTGLAALRSLPGGEGVIAAWTHRRQALGQYRASLEDAGAAPAAVLPSLLHMHHNRAAGVDTDDEVTCCRLARTAALSWTVRQKGALR